MFTFMFRFDVYHGVTSRLLLTTVCNIWELRRTVATALAE